MTDIAYKRKPEKIYLRVIQGGFQPADQCAASQLREKKLKVGDIVGVTVKKLRSNSLNRLVHRIGQLCVANIEEFNGMDAHSAIKRIQLEGNIYCDEISIKIHGFELPVWKYVKSVVEPILSMVGFSINEDGFMISRIPRSLSFSSMDEYEFHEAAKQICRWISEKYWVNLSAEEIESMASVMVEE